MTDRLDALVAREYTTSSGEKKSQWTRIGTAFRSQAGWTLILDLLPPASLDRDGRGIQHKILLMPPKPRDGEPRRGRSEAPRGYEDGYGSPEGDNIPF